MPTAFLWHSIFAWHDVGSGPFGPSSAVQSRLMAPIDGVACPDTKRRMAELVEVSGLLKRLVRLEPSPATKEDVLLFHTSEYVDSIIAGSAQRGGFDLQDGTSHFGHGGYEIALLALGGALQMVEKVMKGEVNNGYALVNPPGHHAEPEGGLGFCLINNVAICAEAALKRFGAKRVAIVDIDVHAGNGAEKGFYGRSDVLAISIHQDRNYPPTACPAGNQGEGEGYGYTLNIPLPPGSGNDAYGYSFSEIVLPALRRYKPDIILVASGVDANLMDPLSRTAVTTTGFRKMAESLKGIAEELCEGKIVFCQEGGYSPVYAPFCVHTMIEVLAEVPEHELLADPYSFMESQFGVNSGLEPHQRAAIDLLKGHLAAIQ